jgi:hypothetical protein
MKKSLYYIKRKQDVVFDCAHCCQSEELSLLRDAIELVFHPDIARVETTIDVYNENNLILMQRYQDFYGSEWYKYDNSFFFFYKWKTICDDWDRAFPQRPRELQNIANTYLRTAQDSCVRWIQNIAIYVLNTRSNI